MNVVLVPALLLLLGLVFYKKIYEPKRNGSKPEKVTKTKAGATAKPPKAGKAPRMEKKAKPRAMSSSGRMGSVL